MGWNGRLKGPPKRRGRPPSQETGYWCFWQDIALHVHRQQIADPSAKLDDAIIIDTASHFGVSTKTVWRALKYHETMTGSRDPHVGAPDGFLKSIHDYCETAILPHFMTDEEIIKEVAPYYGVTRQDIG